MKNKRKLTPNQLFDAMIKVELENEKREKEGVPFKLTRSGLINDIRQLKLNGLI